LELWANQIFPFVSTVLAIPVFRTGTCRKHITVIAPITNNQTKEYITSGIYNPVIANLMRQAARRMPINEKTAKIMKMAPIAAGLGISRRTSGMSVIGSETD
jgi:hypothetical protein